MMMMKKNNTKSSASASKLSSNGRREQQKGSPRSPLKLKDLNISTSYSSSSTATSISSEAPKGGCSRFLLSNHHHSSSANASKNACFRQKSVVGKTPKSAPTVKNLRAKLSDGIKKGSNLQNPQKPTSKIAHRLRRKPPTCSRSGLSNDLASGLSSKSGLSNDFSSGPGIVLSDNATDVTPVTKLASGSDLNGCVRQEKVAILEENDTNGSDGNGHNTPPVEVSVSPEIQGGSASVVVKTPTTCYAAGHVLSGVTDRRKCRPKGLLTVGNKLLFGSSQAKVCDNVDENAARRTDSLVATPIKASIHWISSPLHENSGEGKADQDEISGLRLSSSGMLMMPLDSIGCSSSRSSSFGFNSEVFNKSDSTITASHSGRKGGSFMDFDSNSEFRGLFGPSLEYLVCSPTSMPSCENEHRYANAGETTPWMEDSVGSENVIRTPQSTSGSPRFGSPRLSRDEISRLWFEDESDSVAELIQSVSLSPELKQPILGSPKTSFEFSPLIKPTSSTEFGLFQKAVDGQAFPGDTELVMHNFAEAEINISWKEELSCHVFEMDELDCCRCLSDDGGDSCSKSSPLGSDINSANRTSI